MEHPFVLEQPTPSATINNCKFSSDHLIMSSLLLAKQTDWYRTNLTAIMKSYYGYIVLFAPLFHTFIFIYLNKSLF